MEIPLIDLLDRMSIVRLKIERIDDASARKGFKEEFEKCKCAIRAFERKGVKVKRGWFEELYKINKYFWDAESEMNAARIEKSGPNLKKMGIAYIKGKKANEVRFAVKNKVIEETGLGFKDVNTH